MPPNPCVDARELPVHRLMLFLGLVAWIVLLRAPMFFIERPVTDEGLYYTIAWRMLDGARIYTDVWDNKPVGIFLIYIGIIKLLGVSRFALDLVSAGTVLVGAAGVYAVARLASGSRRAGLIAAFVLPAYMSDLGATGANAENFWMLIQLCAVFLLLRQLAGAAPMEGMHRQLFLFGLLEGALLQLKFTSVFETFAMLCALAAIVVVQERRIAPLFGMAAAFLPGYLFCTGVVFAVFWATGDLQNMIHANFISPRYYVASPFGLADPLGTANLLARRLSYFVVLGLFIAWLAIDLARRGEVFRGEGAAAFLLLAAWLAGAILGALSSGHFMYHYFIALAAPMTILASWSMERVLASWNARRVPATILAVAMLVSYPAALHAKKSWAQLSRPRELGLEALADYALSLVPRGSKVFFGDLPALIYPLSGMVPATRYPMADAHVFDEASSFGVDAAQEIEEIFARRPALVFLSQSRLEMPSPLSDLIRRHLALDYVPLPTVRAGLSGPLAGFRRRA